MSDTARNTAYRIDRPLRVGKAKSQDWGALTDLGSRLLVESIAGPRACT
jgi:hypothetical protein